MANEQEVKRLAELAEELGVDELDDEVHDVFSVRASKINNQGLEAQIKALLEAGDTPGSIEKTFRQIVGKEQDAD